MDRLRIALGCAIVAVLCCVGLGCGKGPFSPLVTKGELLAAPLEIEIDGRAYTIEPFLWRDFMPGDHSGGSDLMAVVFITAVDGQPFPADVDATFLWVINGDEVWATELSEELRPPDQSHLYQLEEVARDGPKWDVGTEVEVVVRVTKQSGSAYLLRATGEKIGATY
ncbi:MAG: hypothetical protein ABFD80_01160 [Acidobacteriota bacterium]